MQRVSRHPLLFAALAQALLLILLYRDLEIPMPLRLASLALFALSCWWRADTGLALVAFTAPLYLIPVSMSGILSHEIHFPLNEMALLAMFPVAAGRWLWEHVQQRQSYNLHAYIPHLLFLLTAILGVGLALPTARGEALRELRWLIIEPLLFYVLLKRYGRLDEELPPLFWGLSLAAAGVAFLGLMQFVGLDLVPALGWKRTHSKNVVDIGSVLRVASVYGHPNNLGLFLERCWPLAFSASLLMFRKRKPWQMLVLGLCTVLALAGLIVSFSRGAWLGSLLAAVVLGLGLLGPQSRASSDTGQSGLLANTKLSLGVLALALFGIVGAIAALELRGGGGSEGARLLLWREALGYIAQHPFGIGLDQFYSYHQPNSGISLIHPALIGSSDEFASHPHNLLLDIWLRLGPLGLLAFGWLLLRFFRISRAQWPAPLFVGCVAAMLAALVHGLVDHFYFVPDLAFVFWTLIAFVEQHYSSTRPA